MVLGGSVLGVSTLLGGASFPSPSEYQSFEIYGSSIASNAWIRNYELTEAQIMAESPEDIPAWDGTTLLLANFSNNLDAGNVGSITTIDNFDVNRRKVSETTFTKLATVDNTVTEYIDVTAEPNTTYIYEVLAKNATEISEPIVADPFDSDFFNWLLIDEETATTYIFNLNVQSNAFTNETSYERYDGYNKFSQFSFGDRDFVTGSVSAILALEQGCELEITQPVEFLDTFREFVNNGKEKILKSRKGHVIRVVTTDYNSDVWLDELMEQFYRISFNFTEVGEVHANN